MEAPNGDLALFQWRRRFSRGAILMAIRMTLIDSVPNVRRPARHANAGLPGRLNGSGSKLPACYN